MVYDSTIATTQVSQYDIIILKMSSLQRNNVHAANMQNVKHNVDVGGSELNVNLTKRCICFIVRNNQNVNKTQQINQNANRQQFTQNNRGGVQQQQQQRTHRNSASERQQQQNMQQQHQNQVLSC